MSFASASLASDPVLFPPICDIPAAEVFKTRKDSIDGLPMESVIVTGKWCGHPKKYFPTLF